MGDLDDGLRAEVAYWASWSPTEGRDSYDGEGEEAVRTFHPQPMVDWEGWVADVQTLGDDESSCPAATVRPGSSQRRRAGEVFVRAPGPLSPAQEAFLTRLMRQHLAFRDSSGGRRYGQKLSP